MCYVLYASLFGLLWLYSDALLEDHVLAVAGEGTELIGIATGWEILPMIWPVLLMAMIFSSVLTLLLLRRVNRTPKPMQDR